MAEPRIPFLVLAASFWLAESFVVHLEFRRDAHTFSLAEIPLVLGMFFVEPLSLLLARILGCALALAATRKQSARKLAFNLANFALQTSVAVVVFHALVPSADPFGPLGWLAAFAGTAVADLSATLAVSAAIALTGGLGGLRGTVEAAAVGAAATFTNTGVGLMAVTILTRDPRALGLLALSAGTLLLAYRAYAALRNRQEGLSALYESTQLGRGATSIAAVLPPILEHARATFRSNLAELVLLDGEGAAVRTVLAGDEGVVQVAHAVGGDPLVARVLEERRPVLVPAGDASERFTGSLRARDAREAMAAPLHEGDEVVGVLIVAGRLVEAQTFSEADLRLFEALANHAGVEVSNVRLIERLRREALRNEHMALHDSLTGLGNRTLFRTRVHQAIARAREERCQVAVLLVDLDRFKEVNDTLGHATGDVLLREIGSRLARLEGTVARLGGDEFGIVLAGVRDVSQAQAASQEVRRVLEQPFLIQDLMLDLSASVGIALYPDHGEDADTLVQRADVAMYLAKEARSGVEVYLPERDGYTPQRLVLAGELRRAIGADGGLSLAFQPKVDARTGALVGVEALCRWTHPRQGPIGPDVFIPIAEHTGLVKPLTGWVLAEALEAHRTWRDQGLDVPVAVNLSARMLRDERLPAQVAGILAAWNVPASALVLELTEGSLMEDPERATEILSALHAMGVRLSIDDFGTGYSSLSYLRRLPVSELKMDRSFVLGMVEQEGDAVIVRSTIELGRNLGLQVVAEGVASIEIEAELKRLGCDVLQGYLVGRPMERDALLAWAQAREPAPAPLRIVAGG